MTARAKRVKYALTVFRKYHKNGAYCTFNKATAKFDFTVVQFFPTILAFTIGHLVSRGILALPPTKTPKHSGKTQVQNISQSRPPSTSWNLGGVANIYIMAAREGKMAVVLKMAQVAASIWLPSDKHPILPRPFFIMKYEHCTVTHLVGRKVNVVGGTWALKVFFSV